MEVQGVFKVTIYAERKPNSKNYVPVSQGFEISIPETMDPSDFFDKDGVPNLTLSLSATQWMIEALAANVMASHKSGFVDKNEHIRYIREGLDSLFRASWTTEINDPEEKARLKRFDRE